MAERRDARTTSLNLVEDEPLDLNRAGWAELDAIAGIGAARARPIVAWREAHGPFKAVEDLQHVPEVGLEAMRQVRPHFKV